MCAWANEQNEVAVLDLSVVLGQESSTISTSANIILVFESNYGGTQSYESRLQTFALCKLLVGVVSLTDFGSPNANQDHSTVRNSSHCVHSNPHCLSHPFFWCSRWTEPTDTILSRMMPTDINSK